MQLTKIALAIGALAAAGVAMAAPNPARIALSAGASAARGNLVTGLTNLCTAGGGVLTTFTSASDTDITTYACATGALTAGAGGTYASTPDANFRNFQGTSFAVFKLNVDQGSFSAAQILNGVAITHFDPGVGAAGADETPSDGTIVGGLSDVEFSAFPLAVQGGFSVSVGNVGVGQTFGVAVSVPLYNAMFVAQQAAAGATVEDPIPSTCAVGQTERLECIPTISKGQFNAIIDSNEFGSAKAAGAQFLAPQLAAGSQLRYIRRVDTSGTQASAQNYFLGLPCSTSPRNIIAEPQSITAPEVLASDDYGNTRVLAAGSTGALRTELNRAVTPGGVVNYAIGVLSGENNQAQAWRWLRVQGAAIGENATPNLTVTNAATARNGQYDFYFETKYFFNNPAQNAFWTTVSAAVNTVTPPVGLLRAADLAGYNKGGDACLANSRN